MQAHELFLCKPHEDLMPKVLRDAVYQTTSKMAEVLTEEERGPLRHSFRMARALGFAAVCDELGIDPDQIMAEAKMERSPKEPEVRVLSAAIRNTLR
jgi:hypothetical protein